MRSWTLLALSLACSRTALDENAASSDAAPMDLTCHAGDPPRVIASGALGAGCGLPSSILVDSTTLYFDLCWLGDVSKGGGPVSPLVGSSSNEGGPSEFVQTADALVFPATNNPLPAIMALSKGGGAAHTIAPELVHVCTTGYALDRELATLGDDVFALDCSISPMRVARVRADSSIAPSWVATLPTDMETATLLATAHDVYVFTSVGINNTPSSKSALRLSADLEPTLLTVDFDPHRQEYVAAPDGIFRLWFLTDASGPYAQVDFLADDSAAFMTVAPHLDAVGAYAADDSCLYLTTMKNGFAFACMKRDGSLVPIMANSPVAVGFDATCLYIDDGASITARAKP